MDFALGRLVRRNVLARLAFVSHLPCVNLGYVRVIRLVLSSEGEWFEYEGNEGACGDDDEEEGEPREQS